MSIRKSAWAEVSGDLVAENLALVRRQVAPGTRLCALLKGDAYGHGLTGMRDLLIRRGLADLLAVGKFSELRQLYSQGGDGGLEVLLLGSCEPEELLSPLREGLFPTQRTIFSVYSLEHFRSLDALAGSLGLRLRVHLRTDGWNSGMGLSFDSVLTRQEELFHPFHLEVCGLYTHLYSTYNDDHTQTAGELRAFNGMVRSLPPELREKLTVHVMNSALVFSFPEYSYDMVRVGTAMYGLPCGDGGQLKPILRICAEVFAVETVNASVPLSYQPESGCVRPRQIARIMLGYWDCPLLLTMKELCVRIRDQIYPLADEVCMDNLCVDVTEGGGEVSVGDTAVLLGEPGVTVSEVLARNGIDDVHSEWLCMTAGRLEKVYL